MQWRLTSQSQNFGRNGFRVLQLEFAESPTYIFRVRVSDLIRARWQLPHQLEWVELLDVPFEPMGASQFSRMAQPVANPTIVSYSTSAVKCYNTTYVPIV
jgi:hypothetical protein